MRHRPTVFIGLAGLAVSISSAHAQDFTERGTFSCTIEGFSWQGAFSDDFLNTQNWVTCLGITAPQTDIPLNFGPQALLVHGGFNQWQLPAGPAVLSSDYSNPLVIMAIGVDTSFTIRNARVVSTL